VVTKGSGDEGKWWRREVVTTGNYDYEGEWWGREVWTMGNGEEGRWRWEMVMMGSSEEEKYWRYFDFILYVNRYRFASWYCVNIVMTVCDTWVMIWKDARAGNLAFFHVKWLYPVMKGTFSKKKLKCFLYFGRDPSGFGAVISSIFMCNFIVFCN
jgi:hypothetical protein